MWLVCVWVFHLMRPALKGSDFVASFKVFGIMCLFFASISAILMNHYSHPKDFYFWIILDGVLMYALVAACNGLLYRRVMGRSRGAVDTSCVCRSPAHRVIQAKSLARASSYDGFTRPRIRRRCRPAMPKDCGATVPDSNQRR